jgi:predicted transcriptional regulator
MKKYDFLGEIIKKEFGSIWLFSKKSGIPRSTLSKLIGGKYGSDETHVRKRIEEKLIELSPEIDTSHIWDVTYTWHQKCLEEKNIIKTGFKITVDCKLNEKGELIVAPSFEGY